MERIGVASGKISVIWGSLKRASKSSWNLVFQSGSLKSMEVEVEVEVWLLSTAKTRSLLATLVGFSGRRRELGWESRSP